MFQRNINVLALVKDKERYVFLYDDDHRQDMLRVLGKYARDKNLSFTRYDAAMLSQRIRQTMPPLKPTILLVSWRLPHPGK